MSSIEPNSIRRPSIRLLLLGAVIAMVVAFALVRQSSNTIVLGSTWTESGRYPIEQFDHSPLTALLSKYVDSDGKVDYQHWQQNPEDRLQLLNYLQSTARIQWNEDRSPRSSIKDTENLEKAFWINVYNAMTIHAILDIYPTSSVRRHTNPIGFNIWNHCKLMVGSRAYSLANIESGPLAELSDARTPFAIVKGSVSCPNLRQNAYSAEHLDQELDSQAASFLSLQSNLFMEGGERVHLSPILKQVFAGYSGDEKQKLDRLSQLIVSDEVRQLIRSSSLRITWMKHDWSLNAK